MQEEEGNVRDVLQQAFQALNSKDDKNHYFDLHDDALIADGIPDNFPVNKKEDMKSTIVSMAAFPDANFGFDHVTVQGTEAACMFSMTGGLRRTNFWVYPQIANRTE
ncbi:MAG TPA: hypothetical protein VE089_05570 [Nitrososphaeraceae archaeon]|nr:hypothetical protein [Nitrososphaeraceae archaeon]